MYNFNISILLSKWSYYIFINICGWGVILYSFTKSMNLLIQRMQCFLTASKYSLENMRNKHDEKLLLQLFLGLYLVALR